MLHAPSVVTVPAQPTAVVRVVVPRDQIQTVMGPAIGEALGAAQAQGVGPVGPVFSHHFRMAADVFDFEVGVPVSAPITPVGRAVPAELPAARVALAIYEGPYEGLGAAWGEFKAWVAAQGLDAAPNLWEHYLTGPESGLPPAKWRTELCQPLVD